VVLPGLVAVICFAIIIGSKYLVGLANWVEVLMFVAGVVLLLIEVFVTPGFGFMGVAGILLILLGLFGMLVRNGPDRFPWPQDAMEWESVTSSMLAMSFGFIGFILLACVWTKYLPRIPIANRLVLGGPEESASVRAGGGAGPAPEAAVGVGEQGMSVTQLRPAGIGRFGTERVSVVSRGELIEANREIIVAAIEGNSIVVKETGGSKNPDVSGLNR
jgi:membrane-bound serine protease (ClpP class)